MYGVDVVLLRKTLLIMTARELIKTLEKNPEYMDKECLFFGYGQVPEEFDMLPISVGFQVDYITPHESVPSYVAFTLEL